MVSNFHWHPSRKSGNERLQKTEKTIISKDNLGPGNWSGLDFLFDPFYPYAGVQTFCCFHPKPWGFMIQFDEHILQMGFWKTTN